MYVYFLIFMQQLRAWNAINQNHRSIINRVKFLFISVQYIICTNKWDSLSFIKLEINFFE